MKRGRLLLALAITAGAPLAFGGTLGESAPLRPGAESTARTSSVRSLYIVHCAGCHGFDGAGISAGNVPDMRRLGRFLGIRGGREFVIKVPGVMGSGLSDQQVADVTNWVLVTLAPGSTPAAHTPYTAAEVQRARATPLIDVARTRAELTEQARLQGIALD